MKAFKISVLFASLWILAVSGNAFADFTVTNTTPDPTGYAITSFNSTNNTINEDYNSTVLVPYPSHDGYAIENQAGYFFQETFGVGAGAAGNYTLTFNVTNTTPYTWSDYHFILGQGMSFSDTNWSSNVFSNSGLNPLNSNELEFWAPNWLSPNQTATFTLDVTLAQGDDQLTQLATTTPIPGAIWMFGPGLAGLIGLKRKYLG